MDKVNKQMIIALFSLLVVFIETDTSVKGICIKEGTIDSRDVNESCFKNNFESVLQTLCVNNCTCKLQVSLDNVLCIQHSFKSDVNITAILEQGIHTPTTDGHLHFAKQNALSLSGNGTKETVILKGINLVLSDIKETTFNNFTAKNSSLNVYGANDLYSRSSISVKNCIIINSQVILTDVILSIKDCEIKQCTHSAIVSYSSFIILAGIVEFSNSTGETGGALNLRGPRIKLLENTNVTFYNNCASEFGGVVFVDNADLYVSQEGYNSFCFYGIEQVDSNYSLNFDGNVAEKGGDHIFGASLKSSCTSAFQGNTCDKIGTCSLASYEILTDSNFKFHPAINATESLSAISSKPTRVCLCNGSGQPQCTDIDSIFYELHIYPGEHFTIPVVIVGGDFGITIGVVYAYFDNVQECIHSSDDSHTMQEQVITQNKECSSLTYCFCGSTDQTLEVYLTARNLAEKVANFTKSRVESSIEDYYTKGLIDQTLLYTQTLLNITFRPCPPGFVLLENPPRCGCYPQLDDIECTLKNGKGYISWNSSLWINSYNAEEGNGITV